VHYCADLQSVHGLRCYGNTTQTRNVSEYMLVLAQCLVVIVNVEEKNCNQFIVGLNYDVISVMSDI